jgi:hypothetical protein
VTQPAQQSPVVTLEKAWRRLMLNMGGVNLQRARDARKAAQAVGAFRRGR